MTEITNTEQAECKPEQATVACGSDNKAEAITPVAQVAGQPLLKLPEDLYIPPGALEVFLEAFQGPMDLLLYLIRRQNIDILDIPIAEITRQYIEYVELMKELKLELAAEYLVMAAMLAEIKSRMLLPRQQEEVEDEEDPRAALVRRLQEYERFKKAAEELSDYPRRERDIFPVIADSDNIDIPKPPPQVSLQDLLFAFKDVLTRATNNADHCIQREVLSTRERMTNILSRLRDCDYLTFESLFTVEEGRLGVVVSFIAILELVRQALIEVIQAEAFSPIHIKAKVS